VTDVVVDDETMALAAEICTAKQMEVLRLRNDGYGCRQIARMLEIAPASAKNRLDGADLRLRKAIRVKGERDESSDNLGAGRGRAARDDLV
jgi:DNA-directed RNA polymerase specialized sigma24 family protein